jgi:FixJ family two-component response regulator
MGLRSHFSIDDHGVAFQHREKVPVVVIDDDLSVRRSLVRLLGASGFEVLTFPSAEAFLASEVDDARICLVLDIHLGGMSGPELADHLDQQARAIPIVFISAQEGSLPADRAVRSETIAFLRKPFDEGVFIEAVSRALTLSRY